MHYPYICTTLIVITSKLEEKIQKWYNISYTYKVDMVMFPSHNRAVWNKTLVLTK